MSVRMRHTRGHTNNRRSHHALSETKAIKDALTGKLRLPHRLDETTGLYRGKQIVVVKTKASKVSEKGASHPASASSAHDHAHDHENAEVKAAKGVKGKVAGRSKTRSSTGGE